MEGASNTTTETTTTTPTESEASKPATSVVDTGAAAAAAAAAAKPNDSYMTKASKYFFGYIFGSGEDSHAGDREPIVQEGDECSEDESDEEESDEKEMKQAANATPFEVRSELVSLEDYCSDSEDDDVDDPSDKSSGLIKTGKSRLLQKTVPIVPSRPVCVKFVRGTCENGDRCPDSHPPELTPAADATEEDKPVCRFFLEGSCRFGDRCKNSHPADQAPKSPVKSKKSRGTKEEKKTSPTVKKSMKTAMDVINRIEWDEMLPKVKSVSSCLEQGAELRT